jgi:type I restriction enzyme S subunit
MTESNSELPSGWIQGKLADFVEPRGEKLLPSALPDAPFLGMDHVEAHTTRIIGRAKASELKSSAARFYKGDVLYGRLRPYLNKVTTPSFDGLASAEFIVFPDTRLVRSQFLKYRLNSSDFVSFAAHLNEGDRPRVAFDQIGEFPILLPPSAEQSRIIAKIEELFSELDKGVEALTTAREQLALFRILVLQQSVCSDDGAIYPSVPLDNLIGPIEQGWSPKCDLNRTPDAGEWAIIKTTVVQPMSYLPDECKPLPNGLAPRPNIEIHDGDILMTRKGPRIRTGVVCYVNKARPRSMMCDTVYRFRANEQRMDPEYLALALNSPHVVQAIDRKKSGISESGISLNHARVRSVQIPVPPSKEMQRRIVQSAKERLSLIEHTQNLIDDEIQRAKVIRQSILKQAFSGQLVAQDPADEPASVLLERIRAERAKASTNKTVRKTRKTGNSKTGKRATA